MDFKIPDTPEELFRQGGQRISNMGKWLPYFMAIFVVIFIALTSFYSIEPDEVGVIKRFGKFITINQPGLHWKLPFNIDRLDKVKVKRIFKEEFGFRTLQAGINTRYSPQSFEEESLMLTGDLNALEVTWIVQFKVKDPVKLLYNVRGARETVRDVSEAVMRQVIGDSSLSEALTIRRVAINQEVEKSLQEILDLYDSGVQIVTVKLQDVEPPKKVQESFNEVNEAKQERERVINEATEAKNRIIPEAKGKAEKTIREAEAYSLERIKRAEGEAGKFLETWNAYKLAKDVTRRRLYLETLANVLPNAGQIYVLAPESTGVLPLLKLNEQGVLK